MRKSTAITLTLLGGAMLSTAACGGCGRTHARTFYDAQHKPVPRSQWMVNGQPTTLYDAEGKPVPPEEVQQAYASTTGSTTTSYRHRSGGWFAPLFFSSGWGRSTTSTSRSTGRTWFGGSKPSVSGGTSRGGFGGTHSSTSS